MVAHTEAVRAQVPTLPVTSTPRPPGPQQTVLTATNLLGPLQALFHKAHPAMPRRMFSFHSPAGRCPTCKGSGQQRVSLDILADLTLPCPACEGHRYRPEVLAARRDGQSIADLLEAPASQWLDELGGTALGPLLRQLDRLALGHLPLGAPVARLSGGERTRLGLAAAWASPPKPGRIWWLERPDEGLHAVDLARLVEQVRERARAGELVVVTTERPRLAAAGVSR